MDLYQKTTILATKTTTKIATEIDQGHSKLKIVNVINCINSIIC